jgi:hypothetical protein
VLSPRGLLFTAQLLADARYCRPVAEVDPMHCAPPFVFDEITLPVRLGFFAPPLVTLVWIVAPASGPVIVNSTSTVA